MGRLRAAFRRFSGLFCINQTLADEPQLPEKQADLNCTYNYQREREESGGVFGKPWFRLLGIPTGLLIGLGLGALALDFLRPLMRVNIRESAN